MILRPQYVLLECVDAGQGPIAVVGVRMPDGSKFKIICTLAEYERMQRDGLNAVTQEQGE